MEKKLSSELWSPSLKVQVPCKGCSEVVETPVHPFFHPAVHLNANRHVTGVLRGFDQFMNLVLDNTVDEKLKVDIGMVVIRGNSIATIEALEAIGE